MGKRYQHPKNKLAAGVFFPAMPKANLFKSIEMLFSMFIEVTKELLDLIPMFLFLLGCGITIIYVVLF